MTTPNQDEPSKLKKILTSDRDESILSRLPRSNGAIPSTPSKPTPTQTALVPVAAPQAPPQEKEPPREKKSFAWRFKFLYTSDAHCSHLPA